MSVSKPWFLRVLAAAVVVGAFVLAQPWGALAGESATVLPPLSRPGHWM